MVTTGQKAFNFEFEDAKSRLSEFLKQGKYFVLVARAESGKIRVSSQCTKASLCMRRARSELSLSSLSGRNIGPWV